MARASIRTYLPLDTWARILGFEPRHFNGVTCAVSTPEHCNKVWMQYAWQDADRVGREEVAEAIAQAESDIIDALGFFPLPDWVDGEIQHTARFVDPVLSHGAYLANTQGANLSVTALRKHVMYGGIKATAAIDAAAAIVWSDPDGDGYDEIATVTAATTVTDVDEIRVYVPGHDQEDEWEIRPLRTVTIAGGVVTITIDRHLLVDPNLWEAIAAEAVNGDDDANFLDEVEIYRVYNDPSDMGELQWEQIPGTCSCTSSTCPRCQWETQTCCLQVRDPQLGFIVYRPATWDADDEEYQAACLAKSWSPSRVSMNYRAGYQNTRSSRPSAVMHPDLARAITYYSVTLLDRPICSCTNVETFINRWREDKSLLGEVGRYQISARELDCPWGQREGALWAWRTVQKFSLQGGAVRY
jgi:hypothetical protein